MIWFLPGLIFCAIAQTTLLGPLSVWGVRPDLFFLLVFLVSQRCTPEAGTVLGFLIGLCQDGLSGGPLGAATPSSVEDPAVTEDFVAYRCQNPPCKPDPPGCCEWWGLCDAWDARRPA